MTDPRRPLRALTGELARRFDAVLSSLATVPLVAAIASALGSAAALVLAVLTVALYAVWRSFVAANRSERGAAACGDGCDAHACGVCDGGAVNLSRAIPSEDGAGVASGKGGAASAHGAASGDCGAASAHGAASARNGAAGIMVHAVSQLPPSQGAAHHSAHHGGSTRVTPMKSFAA